MRPATVLAIVALAAVLILQACSSDSAGVDRNADGDEPGISESDAAGADAAGGRSDSTLEGSNAAVAALLEEESGDLCGVYSEVEIVNRPFAATSDEEARLEATTLVTYLEGLAVEASADFANAATTLDDSAVTLNETMDNSESAIETLRGLREGSAEVFDDILNAVYEIAETCGPP